MQGIVNRHRPMIKIPRGAYKSRQILSNPSKPASMKFRRVSFGVLFTLAATANASTSSCRCLYDQPCWPNESEFAKLATQISQPILHPLPPPFPCYPTSAPSGNCSEVIANYGSNIWRSDQPGAMQLTNYEVFIFPNKTISACYINTTLGVPCGQGSVPPVGVDARSGTDIQAAVNFIRKHNLKLVVKSTGHDFLGRSTARGSFLIWTHRMKDMSYNSTFIPEGAPVTSENTFEGDCVLFFSHFRRLTRYFSCHSWSWCSMA